MKTCEKRRFDELLVSIFHRTARTSDTDIGSKDTLRVSRANEDSPQPGANIPAMIPIWFTFFRRIVGCFTVWFTFLLVLTAVCLYGTS